MADEPKPYQPGDYFKRAQEAGAPPGPLAFIKIVEDATNPPPQPLIGFSTWTDALSVAIREFEEVGNGGTITASHAFFAYQVSSKWVILGENSDGFTTQSAAAFLADNTIVALFRPKFDMAQALYDAASASPANGGIGAAYDYDALFGMVIVEFAHHFHQDVPNITDQDHQTAYCSEKVLEVIQKVVPPLACVQGLVPDTEDPEMLARLCVKYPVNFEAIGTALP